MSISSAVRFILYLVSGECLYALHYLCFRTLYANWSLAAHTTGQDIKQGLDARAVVTLSNDMTLRDMAQGCYRMRGLGQG